MKTKLFLSIASIVLTSCSGGGLLPHRCSFNQEVVAEQYFIHEANCEEGETYYKSCTCGEHVEETFSFGSALGHYWDGGEFYTSEERIFPVTTKDDEVAVIYTCARCGRNDVREDTKKTNIEGHLHFAHSYDKGTKGRHTGDCAICKEGFEEDCRYREDSSSSQKTCHKCGDNE